MTAAIHGQTRGGWLQRARGADIRRAAPDSAFAIPEVRPGLVPDMRLRLRAQARVRAGLLRRLSGTAEDFTAGDALARGGLTKSRKNRWPVPTSSPRRSRPALPARSRRRKGCCA